MVSTAQARRCLGKLLGQSGRLQRGTELRRERGRAVNTRKLLTEAESRLQFNDARSGRLCFVKPSERDQWPDQDDIVDAVTRIGLDGPVSRLRRLMRLPQQEMSERLRAERRERPGIERREPHARARPTRSLAPLRPPSYGPRFQE